MSAPIVCSIGCAEPWNVAGVGLDIRALAACGARAVTVVAGVTAQDGHGVHAAVAIDPSVIAAQLHALRDAEIAAYRVGALLNVASVETLAQHLAASGRPVVYDPVLGPSAGGTFADAATRTAILERLVPIATLVTPNLAEAQALTGLPAVLDRDDMERAGRVLVAAGAGAALVKGGHLAGDVLDVYVEAAGNHTFTAPRLAGDLRGTGCLLACGIAAALARGATMFDAIECGRAFVRERFAGSVVVGGMRVAY
jgi:hydroxymethylpyrimidine/phosphomethylpyrimidine kinase